jgi:two-component system, OmpR family, alkaline phosphatase synthesis response regulator PhoP
MSQSRRVLVADDESHILSVVSLKLRNAGFEVVCAHDGTEALRLAIETSPALLITDFHMPGLSGLEVCQKLREQGKSVPTIMLSARGYHLTEEELENSGISEMVSKPFSPRQLLATVEQVLAQAA